MPKYQIILDSDEQIADDEFLRLCLDSWLPGAYRSFKVVSAQNLEGIHEEVWNKNVSAIPGAETTGSDIADGTSASPGAHGNEDLL